MSRRTWLGPLWLAAVVLVIYLPDVGQGFIKDDFAWVRSSRLASAADLAGVVTRPASGFFRPVVALTFGVNEQLFGLGPFGYGLTNLALLGLCAAGVWRLAGALGLSPPGRLVAASLWCLNFHGINMAVLWLSGRTALLLCAAATWAADALLRGRPLVAGALALVAMLSKEEAVALPVIFAIWLALQDPGVRTSAEDDPGVRKADPGVLPVVSLWSRARVISAGVWPSLLALVIYGLLRSGTTAMTFATAPGVYQARLDLGRLVENALEYLDRSSTLAAAVALAACLLAWRRPRLDARHQRVFAIAAVWFAGMFAITVWLPIRSSLYACTPAVASAIAAALVASHAWDAIPDRRRRLAGPIALVLPLVLWPVYHARNQRLANEARLSAEVMRTLVPLRDEVPPATGLVLLDDPKARPSLYQALGPHLPDAAALALGRPIPVSLDKTPEPALAPPVPDGPTTRRFRLENGRLVDAR